MSEIQWKVGNVDRSLGIQLSITRKQDKQKLSMKYRVGVRSTYACGKVRKYFAPEWTKLSSFTGFLF